MSIIKVISLDAFGTLIFPRIPIGTCYSRFAKEACGLQLADNIVADNFFKVYKEMCMKYPNFGTLHDMSPKTWWNKVISQAIGLCQNIEGYEVPEEQTDRLYNWYGRAEAWQIYPNTNKALKAFKENQIKLAALSNFDERLPKIFKELELDAYFDNIVYSTLLPFWKPDLRIFEHICQLFSINSTNLLHCGDNYEKDYQAARRFGARAAIFLPDSIDTSTRFRDSIDGKSIYANHVMHSLEQLSQYVNELNKKQLKDCNV